MGVGAVAALTKSDAFAFAFRDGMQAIVLDMAPRWEATPHSAAEMRGRLHSLAKREARTHGLCESCARAIATYAISVTAINGVPLDEAMGWVQ